MVLKKYARAAFYRALLNLRKRNIALSPDASFRRVVAGDSSAVYAYVREKAGKRVLVVLNLSNKEQSINIQDKSLKGFALNVFMGMPIMVGTRSWNIEPWGYVVYEYGKGTGNTAIPVTGKPSLQTKRKVKKKS